MRKCNKCRYYYVSFSKQPCRSCGPISKDKFEYGKACIESNKNETKKDNKNNIKINMINSPILPRELEIYKSPNGELILTYGDYSLNKEQFDMFKIIGNTLFEQEI